MIIVVIFIILTILLSSPREETNESYVRGQWETANRWLRKGKITMEEFQVYVESDREYVGDKEWNYWIKRVRRPKGLLNPKSLHN